MGNISISVTAILIERKNIGLLITFLLVSATRGRAVKEARGVARPPAHARRLQEGADRARRRPEEGGAARQVQ